MVRIATLFSLIILGLSACYAQSASQPYAVTPTPQLPNQTSCGCSRTGTGCPVSSAPSTIFGHPSPNRRAVPMVTLPADTFERLMEPRPREYPPAPAVISTEAVAPAPIISADSAQFSASLSRGQVTFLLVAAVLFAFAVLAVLAALLLAGVHRAMELHEHNDDVEYNHEIHHHHHYPPAPAAPGPPPAGHGANPEGRMGD